MTGSLELQDARVELDADAGTVRALDGIRLSIERGETFALVGESGCGKSMTALALMRLLPENGRITGGRVLLDGNDLLDLPEAAMRSVRGARIGMIFQEPATSLNPVLRVGEQIIEAIETHTALRGAKAREKAIDWLARVGIAEPQRRIDDYPFRLSGGQKQRVMIAMTLACEPDFLIADEPTTALDVTIQAQILDLLRGLQREQKMGLLLITHDLGLVAGMAQRVALMYAGQIIEVAEAADFFARPLHPYAQALLRALPDAEGRGRPLQAIAGTVPPLWSRFQGCRFAPRCGVVLAMCTQVAPELNDAGARRQVRCLRYTPGTELPDLPAAAAERVPQHDVPAARVPLLQVRRLSVSFAQRQGLLQRPRGSLQAVREVGFEIGRGRTLALVGESGCGKTTIGKAIVQLLRGRARVDGEVLLSGRDLLALRGADLLAARREVQIVFQDPFGSLNPRLRVLELLEEGLEALRPELGAGQRRERIEDLLARVGLQADALQRYPHEFSGGQRQRIAIARALAVQPKLLICDEPTSALDVSVQAQILNLLRELQRELGLSYLFITHNLGVVEYIADEVAVMRAGAIVEQGSCDDVLGHPQQAYTRELLAAVPRLVAR